MSAISAILQVVASLVVGGSIGYAVSRATGLRLGRVEAILVFLALVAYWFAGVRDDQRRKARLAA